MGLDAARHPDELVFGLLASGFGTKCYDGQYFFDADHPVGQPGLSSVGSVSNVQAGAGPAWFLLDCSQPIKPLIYQNRIPYNFTALTNDGDENVFMRDEYLYGVRARCNVGFGLWQLAYGSKAPLTPDNYAAARAAMQSQVSDSGRPLNVSPTHLVHSPILERDARRLLVSGLVAQTTTGTDAVGVTNEWAGSAKMLMSQYLVAA